MKTHHARMRVASLAAAGTLALSLPQASVDASAQIAQTSSPSSTQAEPRATHKDDAWQRQQPTRERVRDLTEQQGVAQSPAERRQELRTLNELHRDLMPPGATPPAPRLAPPSGVPRAN